MRKVLVILLCLLIPFAALAESGSTLSPSFLPVVYTLDDWGISLALPEDWVLLELLGEDLDRGITFAAADAQSLTNLTLTALALDDDSDLASLKALLEGEDDYQDIETLQLDKLTFLACNREEAEEFGFLLPLDGGYALDFRFACAPEDADELGTLPLEIMYTVRLEEED